ncbi:unnamed protein product [Urochloa humidicola]
MEVLVDRHVRLVDEIKGIIQETGGPSLDEAMEQLALRDSSSSWTEQGRHKAVREEMMRYRAEVEEPAFELLLRRRKAAGAGVRKELVTFSRGDADYLREVLEGVEPRLCEVADAPGVTCLSLNLSWHPSHPLWEGCSASSFVSSIHKNLLLLCVGNCRPGNRGRGFYLVYNTRANSALPRGAASSRSHCDIAGGLAGAAILCLGGTTANDDDDGYYLLAELLLCRDGRSHLPTNKGTLFVWEAAAAALGSQQWVQREVDLPLPPLVAHQDYYSFCADIVFPVGSAVLCWADLLSGALLYDHSAATASNNNNNNKQQTCFHFIPLPDGYTAKNPCEIREQRCPQEFRSMCCCVDDDTLKFVSMDDQQGTVITIWALPLHHPLMTNKSRWHKEASFRVRDLCWDDVVADIKDELKLQPPTTLGFPVISSTLQQPGGGGGGVIYLSLTDYEYTNDNNHQREAVLEATRLYMLTIDMHRWRVLSVFKVPPRPNGTIRHHRLFATRIEFADT